MRVAPRIVLVAYGAGGKRFDKALTLDIEWRSSQFLLPP